MPRGQEAACGAKKRGLLVADRRVRHGASAAARPKALQLDELAGLGGLLDGVEKRERLDVVGGGYDGLDLAGLDLAAVRRQLGAVLQNSQLLNGTVYDNIAGTSRMTMDEAMEAARLCGLEDDVKAMPMGLHTMVGVGGSGLSGGQRQRILIARAIARRPRILLFDEATSALDNHTQAVVSRTLEQLRATRIVIAHRLSTIKNADLILCLKDGDIVEQGTHEELMETCETYQEIYYSQFPEERPAAVKSSKETGKDLDKADKMTEKAEKGAAE